MYGSNLLEVQSFWRMYFRYMAHYITWKRQKVLAALKEAGD